MLKLVGRLCNPIPLQVSKATCFTSSKQTKTILGTKRCGKATAAASQGGARQDSFAELGRAPASSCNSLLTPRFHDCMKADDQYQREVEQIEFEFPAGSPGSP
jgi:hypothetical protein